MDSFLKQFRDRNQAELRWLGELYQCAEASACPRANCAAAPSAGQLALAAVRGLQELLDPQSPVMPLSYSFVSVSELVTKQNIPCCSRLTWSTHQYREWAREAEQRLPNHKALPRANLLLIGYLTDRKCAEPSATNGSDGTWRVRDQSFSVCCKAVSAQPNWLQQFMLFPSWNYIPQNASAQNQQTRGFLELTAPPVPLTLDIASVAPERSCSEIITVADVIKVLQQRRRKGGVRLHVHGVVSVVCPLLDIAGKSFFCFCLKDGESSVPVLVLDVDHLCWQQCLRVGEGVCVSELRVCALRTLGGYKVLCVTPQSHLSTAQAYPDVTESGKEVSEGKVMEVKTESGMEVKRDVKRWRVTNPDSGENCAPPTARTKISKMISYKGVLTKVLDAESGLFELDGQVGLCLAYQPSLRMASSLRPGVQIEIHNVHFLYRASSICPDVLLCVCLRSSLRVTNFSGLQPGGASHPNAEAPALRILLEKNLGISEYLWLCHCMKTLKERLCPRLVRDQRVAVVATRLLDLVLPPRQEGPNHRRDIYREMLLEPHCCPLLEYTVGSPHQELLSVKDLLLTMERECWHSLSLASLLPPSGPYLMRTQLNPLLSWSFHSLPAWSTPKPPVLVGVLESQGKGVCVRLADQTGAVDCVAVGSEDGQSHCTASNTAWLGCLVSIQRFTMVVERFLKTDFPSWRHLDDEHHVTHRHCRVYIQFCVGDLQILSPSASMAALLSAQQEQKAGDGGPKEKGAAEDGRVSRMEVTMAQKAVGGGGHRDRDSEQARHEGLQGVAVTVGNSCGVGPTDATGGSELSADDKSPRPKIPRLAEERDGAEYGGRSSGAEGGAGEPGAVRGRSQSDGCVSVVFRVESKQGLTFQNVYTSSVASGRSLCFHVTVMMFGEPRLWAENPRVHPLEASETMGVEPREVDLQFVEKSVCWFPLLQVDGVYRLVAPHTQDPGVLCVPSAPSKGRAVLHSTPYLLVQPQWRLYTLPPSLRPAPLPMVTRAKELVVMSVSQVLYSSSASALVTFQGLITSRITLEENEKVPCFPEEYSETGADVESSLNVKLTVGDLAIPGQIIHVYLKLSGRPYIPGLVPGARVLLQYFQRSVSRTDSVYCRSVPISCVTVTALPPTDCGTLPVNLPVPAVLLGEWALVGARRCAVGRVRAYVTCVLYLQMQWVCSLCGNIFKQDRCVQKYPPCTSTIGVFQAEAKVAVDDGSGEAQVWISSQMVSGLLGLGVAEWEGIQRLVKVRGHVRVYSQGRNMVSIADAEDPLVEYLSSLCVSTVVCRPLNLTCQLKKQSPCTVELRHETAELKRFCRREREFVTKMADPLQVSCLELSPWQAWE